VNKWRPGCVVHVAAPNRGRPHERIAQKRRFFAEWVNQFQSGKQDGLLEAAGIRRRPHEEADE
jgi:hypothetical protein